MQAIIEQIRQHSGRPFTPDQSRHLGGGCINDALMLSQGDQHWFVKLNRADRLEMFEAEAAGLHALADTGAIRVPRPLCSGIDAGQSFIVLEYIDLGGRGDGAEAGRQLARLHGCQAERFGWWRDNHIGSTPQANAWCDQWIDFWRERRLGPQLKLLQRKGLLAARPLARAEQLLERFPALIDHRPAPSLLHGDLWGGNLGYDRQGMPVIYDPAVYYGDREAEIAMTELFGGLGRDFYTAYNQVWPLDAGYKTRKTLYNLYHILNHANLFGGSYLGQAQSMIESLLADC
ncbi:fructosamine kinase family protein [Magnetovirga frankeli]|uniref:fructosamine kinase family protein n=1 Tax=Magnetovirga frankeli TaxID=947516 RepID=UPI001293BF01|nr:fructosamine kinase family protein [gamma proteobacterium SS-5]